MSIVAMIDLNGDDGRGDLLWADGHIWCRTSDGTEWQTGTSCDEPDAVATIAERWGAPGGLWRLEWAHDIDIDAGACEIEGGACPHCGERATRRVCEKCGQAEWIIDCGHYEQPRPLAADEHGHIVCDDCCDDN